MAHGVFKRAQRVYGLSANPVATAERQPSRRHGDIQVLDPGDVALLASHARDEQDAAIYTIAAFTGLRLGELLALRWRDVDFAKRIVHVRWSYVGRREDRPKSHRVRSVPLIDQAARALDQLSRREHFTGDDDLVFGTITGGHLSDDVVRDAFYAAIKSAGLEHLRAKADPIVFHDLRHHFGTRCARRGSTCVASRRGWVTRISRRRSGICTTCPSMTTRPA